MTKRTVCFYAHVDELERLETVQFYRRDIDSLRAMGFDVVVASHWRDVPWNADLYFIWWWTWAHQPLIKARLKRAPTIITGAFNSYSYLDRPYWQRLLLDIAVKRASMNVMISEQELGYMRGLFPDALFRYIPCSVDPSTYKASTIQRDANLVFTIAWLGEQNASRKSIPEIVDAIPLVLAENPASRFVFAGKQGAAYTQLRAQAVLRGVDHSIKWMGTVSEDSKIALLQRCGVYLQPSRYEGFGLAILEAMSCAAPIVTSAVGAVPEVVGDTALFCDGESPRSIADAVLFAQRHPEQAEQMGSRARLRAVRLFPNERRTSELSAIVDELIGNHSPQ